MLFTLMLGAPVRSQGRDLGTLSRIIVNNGVANQLAVNPGLLGLERVVPISDVREATAEQIVLDITDDEWKAYSAFKVGQHMVSDSAAAPSLLPVAPRTMVTSEIFDVPTAEATPSDRSVDPIAVTLSHSTHVGDRGRLAGLVTDTGIPQELVLEGGETIPFAQVGVLDEEHIRLGPAPQRMDGATEAGTLGDAPPRMDGATPAGALGDRPAQVEGATDTSRPINTN
jgi:hypothetical protein